MSTINTVVNHGVTLADTGNYTSPLLITATGAVISGYGDAVIGPDTAAWTVGNQGTVAASAGDAVHLLAGGLVDNTNLISAFDTGVEIIGAAGTVTNSGTILGYGGGIALDIGGVVVNFAPGLINTNADGVQINNAAVTVTNLGTIAAGGRGVLFVGATGMVTNAGTITAVGNAIDFTGGGGSTVNNTGGLIQGRSGVVIYGAAGNVMNSGTIIGNNYASYGYGILFDAGGVIANDVVGLIQANSGLVIHGVTATVTNAGRITGSGRSGVNLTADSNTVVNSGIIRGNNGIAVYLGGSGDNLLNLLPGYRLYGIALGGYGLTNTLQLSGSGGTIAGLGSEFVNFDIVTVDAGAAWTIGGSNAVENPISVGAGATIGIAGTINGVGTAVALAGNDTVQLTPGYALQGVVAGGSGNALALGGAAPGTFSLSQFGDAFQNMDAFNVLTGANWDLTGIGTIVNGVTIAAGATVAIDGTIVASGTAASLGGSDVVRLLPGYSLTGVVGGGSSNTLALGGTVGSALDWSQIGSEFLNFNHLQIDPSGNWTLTGTGTIGAGIVFTDFGTMTNTGTVTVGGAFEVEPATLINSGVILGTVQLIEDNYLLNTATGTIAGTPALSGHGAASTIVNAGNIAGAAGGFGMLLEAGNVINLYAARIAGGSYGIDIYGTAGTVVNAGTISGTFGAGVGLLYGGSLANTASGLIQGQYGVQVLSAPATVTNAGTIGGTYGIQLLVGGSVYNSAGGLIQGRRAVYISGAVGTVTNAGVIDGTANYGVNLSGGGSVINNAGGFIEGRGSGVFFASSPGAVANSGTIVGTYGFGVQLRAGGGVANNASGLIKGYGGVYLAPTAGTLVNAGTIIGTGGWGAYLQAGTTLTNDPSGLIQGRRGVYLHGGVGTVTNAGAIVGTAGSGIVLDAGGTVVDSGTISGIAGTFSAGVFFDGYADNRLVLQNGYQIIGGVHGSSRTGAANTLELSGAAGALTVSYNSLGLTNFGTIVFGVAGGSLDTLKVSNIGSTLAPTISGFDETTEIIDLTQIGTDGQITNNDTINHRVTITGSLGSVTLQLDATAGPVLTTASDGASGTDLIACYLRGTLILTDRGEVPIEALAIGDRVVTLSGEAKPIRWIGRRAYDGRFIAANPAVLPIRVAAGALADGLPARDLWLSPEHSLYLDGVLVQAMHLLNGATINQPETGERVEYFHLELAAHEVIFAEGAAAETFVDCDNRLMFQNGVDYVRLYPDDQRQRWKFCAPRPHLGSTEVTAIRAALLERAVTLGHALAGDPDLHLVVDGLIISPRSVSGQFYDFAVPAGGLAVWLASRGAVPTEIDPTARDIRRLGVAVERIVLCGSDLSIEVSHSHGALLDGFHDDEASHRWTNGWARLPEALLRPFLGGFTVRVRVAESTLQYWVSGSHLNHSTWQAGAAEWA